MKADFLKGTSLLKRDDESLYEYWLSFSPMAPFFGVRWRFDPSALADAAAPAPRSKSASKPAAKAASKTASGSERPDAPIPPATPMTPMLELVAEMMPKPAAAPETRTDAAEAEIAPAEAPTETGAADEDGLPAVKPTMLYDPAPAHPDDLKAIKGVGPKLEAELNAIGLYTYAQIAALTPENLVWIDENLTSFKGRSIRDDWVGQAEALLKG